MTTSNHKSKSAVLFRLLTQTIEAPKKTYRTVKMTKTQKETAEKYDSK